MFLCIDTITSAAGITVVGPDLTLHFMLDPMNSSSGVIPTIDEALKAIKVDLADLKGILIIRGPGSFTGLRVGLSVGNQFSHQLKLPIVGLRTDEWWLERTPNSDVLYIQSMNKEEVYISKNGKVDIVSIFSLSPQSWMGQISQEHRKKLTPEFVEIVDLLSIEDTWQKVARNTMMDNILRTYNLVEPFYGKAPNITQRKK